MPSVGCAESSHVPTRGYGRSRAGRRAAPRECIDGDSPDNGVFILLLNVTDHVAYFVNGPTASYETMTYEEFLRRWTGVALLPRRRSSLVAPVFIVGCGVGAGIPVWLKKVRAKAKRSARRD